MTALISPNCLHGPPSASAIAKHQFMNLSRVFIYLCKHTHYWIVLLDGGAYCNKLIASFTDCRGNTRLATLALPCHAHRQELSNSDFPLQEYSSFLFPLLIWVFSLNKPGMDGRKSTFYCAQKWQFLFEFLLQTSTEIVDLTVYAGNVSILCLWSSTANPCV